MLDTKIAAAEQRYARLLDTPVTSLDAFVSEAQGQRYTLGKLYTQINTAHAARQARNVLLIAAAVTLLVLARAGLGPAQYDPVRHARRTPLAAWAFGARSSWSPLP